MGYVDRMRDKSPTKWGVQMAGMNFKTHSSTAARNPVRAFSFSMISLNAKSIFGFIINSVMLSPHICAISFFNNQPVLSYTFHSQK